MTRYFYVVTSDDNYNVTAEPGEPWWSSPALNNQAMHAAGLCSGEEAEEWLRAHTRGPFPNAEVALRDLLGDPR
jgi:hypothetical protein